mmetsp:Transcript_148617/g.276854  ORF Transcript_148617/g.276854 Transcript_148617/m.276854 type:complete len:352 (+) Transcript_148617:103-1158(+)
MAAVGQKEEGISTSCQTDITAAPPAPLPLQYPANLIYAQNMLAICMSQMQRVDLNIAQLRFYLREHQIRAATAAVLSSSAPMLSVPAPLAAPPASEATTVTPPSDAASEAAAAAAAAEVPAPEAAPAGAEADGAPQQDHLRVHRRRLAAAVKIAFVMVLLEVRTGWYFAYFFLVFLYIGGLFDPFIEWFQRRPVRVTLEQQLTALRNQQRREEERSASERERANSGANSNNANTGSEQPGGASSSGAGTDGQPAQSSGSPPEGAPGADAAEGNHAEASGSASAASAPVDQAEAIAAALAADEGNDANGSDGAAAEQPAAPRPPWSHRFIYQLVVMFFMTLLPWWNPDPRYL